MRIGVAALNATVRSGPAPVSARRTELIAIVSPERVFAASARVSGWPHMNTFGAGPDGVGTADRSTGGLMDGSPTVTPSCGGPRIQFVAATTTRTTAAVPAAAPRTVRLR